MTFKVRQRLRFLFRCKPRIIHTLRLNKWDWEYDFNYKFSLVTKIDRIKRLRRKIGRTTFRKDVFTRVTKLTDRDRYL
jgi:hypothetical protein